MDCSFINGLFEEIDRLKGQVNAGHTQDSHPPDPSQSHIEHTPRSLPPRPDLEPAEHEERGINPTFSYRSWFDNRNVFHTPILIGEAADTAFATRFRQVISDPRVPSPLIFFASITQTMKR